MADYTIGSIQVSEGEMNHAPFQTVKAVYEAYGFTAASRLWQEWHTRLPKFGNFDSVWIESRKIREWLDERRTSNEKQPAGNDWRAAKPDNVLTHGDLILAAVRAGKLGEPSRWEFGLVRVDRSDGQTKFREVSGKEWSWSWSDVRFWMPVTAPRTEMDHV